MIRNRDHFFDAMQSKLVITSLAAAIALSGCAAMTALSYSPMKRGQERITGVTDQIVKVDAMESCETRVDEKELSLIGTAMIPVAAGKLLELLGKELAARVAKLEESSQRKYSDTIFLDDAQMRALMTQGCLRVRRQHEDPDKAGGHLSAKFILKPIQRGKSGVSFMLNEWAMANTVSETRGKNGDPELDLVISVAIKAIKTNDGVGEIKTVSQGDLTKTKILVPERDSDGNPQGGRCMVDDPDCASTDLMAWPVGVSDFYSLSVSVLERGSFSNLSLAKAEIEALSEALGGALGEGLKADIERTNDK